MTHIIDEVGAELSVNGYALLGARPVAGLAADMVSLASALGGDPITGRSGSVLDVLKICDAAQSHAFSLSRVSGAGMQPWHVDGSHLVVPPHLLIIGCQASGGGDAPPTQLLRLEDAEISWTAAGREPFLVRNGRASFYSMMTSEDRPWVRFDPGCMTAQTEEGQRLMTGVERSNARPTFSLDWVPGQILIVDNWRMLHRRGAGAHSGCRALLRMSLLEKS